jgi:Ca-activated chloride channel family protein
MARLIGSSLTEYLAPDFSTGKSTVKFLALLGGLGSLVIALANPQVGTRLEEVKREGIDLFVAMDVSLSMKAEDIRPNRLEKAKRDVSDLLRKLQGDRVGLIVFAGDAFVQFPLTSDYSAADLFISAVDVDAVPTPGTRIASAIQLALKSFATDAPTQKAIIVVTDGENNEGDVNAAVEEANERGVKVYTVGMGTTEGGPIPMYNAEGRRVDYKRDRNGSIVLTKLDETALEQVAAGAGGSYRRATSGGNEIDDLFEEISTLQKTEFGTKQVTGFETRYQYPLALALLFLLLEGALSV